MIAADGFDFSKPYQQKDGVAPIAGEGSTDESALPQKNQRPIAFLLGGLGRKH